MSQIYDFIELDILDGNVLIFSVLVPMSNIIQATIEYTRDRKAFGKSILDNQTVHFRYTLH